jgi:V8-like Glu-specific endopeptidase
VAILAAPPVVKHEAVAAIPVFAAAPAKPKQAAVEQHHNIYENPKQATQVKVATPAP